MYAVRANACISTAGSGGAVYVAKFTTSVAFANCNFVGNTAGALFALVLCRSHERIGYGGAIFVDSNTVLASFADCTFTANIVTRIFSFSLVYVLFTVRQKPAEQSMCRRCRLCSQIARSPQTPEVLATSYADFTAFNLSCSQCWCGVHRSRLGCRVVHEMQLHCKLRYWRYLGFVE